METPPVSDPTVTHADRIFSPGGLAVALDRGLRIAVDDAPGVPSGTYVTGDDLSCAACGTPLRPPRTGAAKWVAYNVLLNDGVCAACDAD